MNHKFWSNSLKVTGEPVVVYGIDNNSSPILDPKKIGIFYLDENFLRTNVKINLYGSISGDSYESVQRKSIGNQLYKDLEEIVSQIMDGKIPATMGIFKTELCSDPYSLFDDSCENLYLGLLSFGKRIGEADGIVVSVGYVGNLFIKNYLDSIHQNPNSSKKIMADYEKLSFALREKVRIHNKRSRKNSGGE